MRKGVFLFVVILCCLFLQTGCSGKLIFLAKQQISEYRECLFMSTGEDFVATFTSGKREEPYSYNGHKGRLVEFGVLSVKYNAVLNADSQPQYVLFIDTMQYEGLLEFNPIDNTYVADIAKNISCYADMYLRVYGGGVDEQMQMPCVSKNWQYSYKQAFDIAVKQFNDVLEKQLNNNNLKGEFFIKIVGDIAEVEFDICWYVCYIGQDKTMLACIISPNSGEVLASKVLVS